MFHFEFSIAPPHISPWVPSISTSGAARCGWRAAVWPRGPASSATSPIPRPRAPPNRKGGRLGKHFANLWGVFKLSFVSSTRGPISLHPEASKRSANGPATLSDCSVTLRSQEILFEQRFAAILYKTVAPLKLESGV